MQKMLRIAWRNVWRNKRRSFITISAIAFAMIITSLTRSLQIGSYDVLESRSVRLFTGELQVQHEKFYDDQTLNRSFRGDAFDWQKITAENTDFTSFTKRISSGGLISSEASSAGGMIVGIEPENEISVTEFSQKLKNGEILKSTDRGKILIGRVLAENLSVDVGDQLVILSQGFRNEMAVDLYTIKGVVRSGDLAVDRMGVFMTLTDAQELFAMEDRITQVVFKTTDFRRSDHFAEILRSRIEGVKVMTWQALLPDIEQMIELDNVSGVIMLFFILIIIGFEIFNTAMMSIIERTKEFGILQAIGLKPRQIGEMVLLESVIKIVIAIAIGLGITWIILFFVADIPITMGEQYQQAVEDVWGYDMAIKMSNRSIVYTEPLKWITIISVLSLIYPIWRVTKLLPVDAMRR